MRFLVNRTRRSIPTFGLIGITVLADHVVATLVRTRDQLLQIGQEEPAHMSEMNTLCAP
jgi:hypothetical protein